MFDLTHMKELLLAGEHCLIEISVQVEVLREIELDYRIKLPTGEGEKTYIAL